MEGGEEWSGEQDSWGGVWEVNGGVGAEEATAVLADSSASPYSRPLLERQSVSLVYSNPCHRLQPRDLHHHVDRSP